MPPKGRPPKKKRNISGLKNQPSRSNAPIAWDWQAMQPPGQCASSGSIGKSPSGQWCRLTLFLLHLIPTDKICDPDNCQIVSILPPKNLAALKTRGNFIKTLFLASIWPSGSKSVVSFRQKTRVPEIINWMSLIVRNCSWDRLESPPEVRGLRAACFPLLAGTLRCRFIDAPKMHLMLHADVYKDSNNRHQAWITSRCWNNIGT